METKDNYILKKVGLGLMVFFISLLVLNSSKYIYNKHKENNLSKSRDSEIAKENFKTMQYNKYLQDIGLNLESILDHTNLVILNINVDNDEAINEIDKCLNGIRLIKMCDLNQVQVRNNDDIYYIKSNLDILSILYTELKGYILMYDGEDLIIETLAKIEDRLANIEEGILY